jgi:hypothetical protein
MSEKNVEVVRRYYARRYYGERSEAPETFAAEASAFWESDSDLVAAVAWPRFRGAANRVVVPAAGGPAAYRLTVGSLA